MNHGVPLFVLFGAGTEYLDVKTCALLVDHLYTQF